MKMLNYRNKLFKLLLLNLKVIDFMNLFDKCFYKFLNKN